MKTTKFHLARAMDVVLSVLVTLSITKYLMLFMFAAYSAFRVEHALAHMDGPTASMETARTLMKQAAAFAFPEGKSEDGPRLPADPAVTGATRSGDCKDRAWWLATRLNDSNLIFAVGKLSAADPENHAWLFWKKDGQLWVLDPIFFTAPVLASKVPPQSYVVEKLYTKYGTFDTKGSYDAIADLL
jgi:hypothetical protein